MKKKPAAVIINFSTNILLSIDRALQFIGFETKIINEQQDISSFDLVVLPGVGAYQRAMHQIKTTKLLHSINDALNKNKKFLSICLGMQLLFEESEEFGFTKGIGFFNGKVESFKKLNSKFNTFIGWNNINFKDKNFNSEILKDDQLIIGSNYYFVHSLCVTDSKNEEIKGVSTNGETSFVSIIYKQNVIATQFHPEKSGKPGIKLLKEFLNPEMI